MADYCTLRELVGAPVEGALPGVTGYLPDVTTDEDKAKLANVITRSSRRIDDYVTDGAVENYFAPSPAAPTPRIIRGDGNSYLSLPEFVAGSVTTVTAPAGFTVHEYDEVSGRLIIKNSAGALTRYRVWVDGMPYTVTARYGFAATPGAVTEACLMIVVRTYRSSDEAFSGVIGNINRDNQIIERALPAAAQEMLDVYRRKYRSRRFAFA